MAGEPSHFEIGVPDARRARTFYANVLGWEFHDWGRGDNAWIETPSRPAPSRMGTPGARGGLHDDDPERRIEIYFAVPDIDAAVSRVRAAGGEAEDPSAEQPQFGRFASCQDDQGVRFGLHQPPSG